MAKRYNATVTGTPDWKGKPTIVCNPPWGGNIPLTIYLKEEQRHLADALKKGDTITVEQGNVKTGKDASKEYNFYWNLAPSGQAPDRAEAIRNMPQVAPKPSAPGAGGSGSTAVQSKPDPTREPIPDTKQFRTAIEMTRRDALEFAVHLWGTGAPEEDVMGTAERFVGWLETGKRVLNPNPDDPEGRLPF